MRPPYEYANADRDYANSAFIAGSEGLYGQWQQKAKAFRQALGPRAILSETRDIFEPEGAAKGTLIFIHGGYWMECSPRDFSHLAGGALARGWRVVMPFYPLAPKASLGQMVDHLAKEPVPPLSPASGPIVLTGHSAGGHLAARLANADIGFKADKVVPISPLAELAPLMASQMNDTLKIDAQQAASQSPARLACTIPAHVVVGQDERPAFLWQARVLSEEWNCPWTPLKGAHHFSVLDGFEEPYSELMQILLT